MRLASWLLLFSSAVLTTGRETPSDQFHSINDGVVDEEYESVDSSPQYEDIYETATQRCCTDADPSNLLVVSTMDGKMQALDVSNGGLIWQSDLDGASLLGGNLGKMEPLSAEGDRFVLVPSLDGSLYMFSMEHRVLEPIPLSTDMLLHSVRIGKEAVAGGKSISTTGVDPSTGKIRYHCTSAQCEQSDSNQSPYSTLVFRRVSHNIRAVDALNGSEKWNLSVSEYDATLVRKHTTSTTNGVNQQIRFIVSPPKGRITAVDSCGRTLWTTSLGVHIARSWHLDGHDLREVSLFESNIHSIQNIDEQRLIRPESLFYLGTINNDPFILSSDKLRSDMNRLTKQIDYVDHASRKFDANSRAIVRAGGSTYQITEGVLDEVLGVAFKQSIDRLNERRDRDTRAITYKENGEPNEMRIALPASEEGNNRDSCEANDNGVLMIGEDNIKNAEPLGNSGGDQGWFITRPAIGSINPGFKFFNQPVCAAALKKSLRLEKEVNPLWRLLAIVLLFITVIGMFKFSKLRRQWNQAKAQFDRTPSVDISENPLISPTSISAPNQVMEPSGEPAPVRKAVSDEFMIKKVQIDEKAVDNAARIRNISTRSGSNNSSSENYQSKFLCDYEPVKVLGRGGFGVVFEARNKLDECHYAVKRIAVANNEKAIKRVLREVRAMAMLDHTGIIRYYHTWIETPPEGVQKELDKDVLAQIKARKNGIVEAIVSDSSTSASEEKENGDPSSYGLIAPPPLVECRSGVEDSWDESTQSDKNENSSSGSDSSSEASTSSSDDNSNMIEFKKDEDHSDSIVFGHSSNKSGKSQASAKSLEVSKLATDMVLVTSNDEELLPCKNTTNYVYLYIQMQLCLDKTLYAWLQANKKMESRDPQKMKMWMKQMVSAVDYIHQQGLIHRDIKPQNVFFGPSHTIKIGDLGLVTKGGDAYGEGDEEKRRSSSTVSLHTDNVGTRTYMSPEQLANEPYTSKVDVFSLGLIFTELNVPFCTLMERSKVLSGLQNGIQPEHLADRPELANFVAWLTSKSADLRPTCGEILASPFLSS